MSPQVRTLRASLERTNRTYGSLPGTRSLRADTDGTCFERMTPKWECGRTDWVRPGAPRKFHIMLGDQVSHATRFDPANLAYANLHALSGFSIGHFWRRRTHPDQPHSGMHSLQSLSASAQPLVAPKAKSAASFPMDWLEPSGRRVLVFSMALQVAATVGFYYHTQKGSIRRGHEGRPGCAEPNCATTTWASDFGTNFCEVEIDSHTLQPQGRVAVYDVHIAYIAGPLLVIGIPGLLKA
ncbi:hypothetical protein PG997_013029 [Apiospora hydei]|uniref:Uncharacterized protein n=1 Tax=Apiospora hydei TaxID=1337664 RepID=A0ABR1V523_9PEZI